MNPADANKKKKAEEKKHDQSLKPLKPKHVDKTLVPDDDNPRGQYEEKSES